MVTPRNYPPAPDFDESSSSVPASQHSNSTQGIPKSFKKRREEEGDSQTPERHQLRTFLSKGHEARLATLQQLRAKNSNFLHEGDQLKVPPENSESSEKNLHKEILENKELCAKIDSEFPNGACYIHKNELLKIFGIKSEFSILVVKGFDGKPIFYELIKEHIDNESTQIKKLGKGHWGTVREVRNMETGEIGALKKYVLSQLNDDYARKDPKGYLQNLTKILDRINENKASLPSFATFFGYGFAKDKKGEDCFYILLEKLERPLSDVLESADFPTRAKIANEIIRDFQQIHASNIHLGDFEIKNLMFDHKNVLKFFDIDLAHLDIEKGEFGADDVSQLAYLIFTVLGKNKEFLDNYKLGEEMLNDYKNYDFATNLMALWTEQLLRKYKTSLLENVDNVREPEPKRKRIEED